MKGTPAVMWICCAAFACQLPAQAQDQTLRSSELFAFRQNMWLDMHHTLYYAALRLEQEMPALPETSIVDDPAWTAAVSHYRDYQINRDLRTDPYMEAVYYWVRDQPDDGWGGVAVPDSFRQHLMVLQNLADGYRKEVWPNHQRTIQQVLDDNWSQLVGMELAIRDSLQWLTYEPWPSEVVRVDMVRYGMTSARNMRPRPYSRIFPTELVMYAVDEPAGNWLELLVHESSHQLILSSKGFVAGTIQDVANDLGVGVPRSLWHAYLFYFSGILTQSFLAKAGKTDYTLYMERNGVFSRYYPALQAHLPDYMAGKCTLAEATRRILKAL